MIIYLKWILIILVICLIGKEIFAFLDEFSEATSLEIKSVLNLSNKVYSQCMAELSKELLVTVTAQDKKINNNWSSFFWGHMNCGKEQPRNINLYIWKNISF